MSDAANRSLVLTLRKLRRRKFERVRVRGVDALVAFVPQDREPPPAVSVWLREVSEQRWYPDEGGHVVKWPHNGAPFDPDFFHVEQKGWNHEHCSACNASVWIDEPCWITRRGSFVVLCRRCHRRLLRLRMA